MKKIDSFTNKYSISKTLRFRLIPQGKTEEYFGQRYLKSDEARAEEYELVKEFIDRYHKAFIEKVLSSEEIPDHLLIDYYNLFVKNEDLGEINTILKELVSDFFKIAHKEEYNCLFKKELMTGLLPSYLTSDDEKKIVEHFSSFTTYFSGFNKNRENIYLTDTTSVAYRCIEENLVKFTQNIIIFKKIIERIASSNLSKIDLRMDNYFKSSDVLENITSFNKVLSQSGIDKYNTLIGGYTTEKGEKHQGINEIVNLYNQVHEKKDRIPLLVPLYKQILTDRTLPAYISNINDDDDIYIKLEKTHSDVKQHFDKLYSLISDLSAYKNTVYISAKSLTNFSNKIYGSWNYVKNQIFANWTLNNSFKEDKLEENFKKIKVFGLIELEEYCDNECKIEILKQELLACIEHIYSNYNNYLSCKNKNNRSLYKNEELIASIKSYLDSIKELQHNLEMLSVLENIKNDYFNFTLKESYEALKIINTVYNNVRNYITKKPYSNDKIKLNFENSQLFGGWDKNKERDYKTILLKDNDKYYVGIMDKNNTKSFISFPVDQQDNYEKMEYKLLPGPNKMLPKVFFAKSNIALFDPNNEIKPLYDKGTFKKGNSFNKNDLSKIIEFYKRSLEIHPDWNEFGFKFKESGEYNDIAEFYNDVANQGYKINFVNISKKYVNNLVEKGELYLFEIYSKDFSKYSKGNQNLHTMYFKMLFDKNNLKDVVYKLNGGCEMFYRKASIKKDKPTHPANEPIKNKNVQNPKKESIFSYDLIKDKRYTENQFYIHIPVTMNFKEKSNYSKLNTEIREQIVNTKNNYIIGIDRGERNLIYLCVIDEEGKIIEQESLNSICSGQNNNYVVDYHNLLDEKEKERLKSRQSWKTVNNIKEIKEGYLSQVVHKICEYVFKYDAIISLENLNNGFKNSRVKIEKQVYEKFETALIKKLSYLVLKEKLPNEIGGVLKAYQLASIDTKNSIQNGLLFYVPAWNTSKIDPTTGFVNLFSIKYENIEKSKEFISSIDSIRFNDKESLFEFSINYDKFKNGVKDVKKKWMLCSYGTRIKIFRNPEKNSEWENKEINLTDEFINLFESYKIDFKYNLKEQMLSQTEKDFYDKFLHLFKMMLQMRNSVTGSVDIDYILSPVKNKDGNFFDSRKKVKGLPLDADANGAYNIARKALMIVKKLKNSEDLDKCSLAITEKEWLEYAQNE